MSWYGNKEQLSKENALKLFIKNIYIIITKTLWLKFYNNSCQQPYRIVAKAYLPKNLMDFVVFLPYLYEGTNIQIFSLITIKIIELHNY